MTANPEQLLFLPGASGNTDFWRPFAERFHHPGRRLFFGWPGFGGLPADPSVRGLSDLSQRVALDITGPSALFAQSMGGVIALLTALAKPTLVTRLVLATTSGGVDVAALGGRNWRAEFRAANPHVPGWFETERWDLSERLSELRIPVLLLWGDADPISPVEVGEHLKRLLPQAELVVLAGGTHDLVMERAAELVPHIEHHFSK